MVKSARKKQAKTADQIAAEIHSELRRILEIRRDVYAPIASFEPAPPFNGTPRFFVLFDRHQRVRFAEGLKLGGLGVLSLPDERLSGLHYDFALAVWHLKDRLHQYAKASAADITIKDVENATQNLRICSDLANWKKHGSNENRSGLNPYLSEVRFDTKNSGPIELYYDGAMKRKGLIVTNPVPIDFFVDVLTGSERTVVGVTREIVNGAFEEWIPSLDKLGLLSPNSPVSKVLRTILVD